jgi:broad specificity phosphatase PhoE
MSSLTLVRHGQATAFAEDTDQLSSLGELQARALGKYWADSGVAFDEVYSGSLTRQRRTAAIVGAIVSAAQRPWPHVRVDPDFNEYDGDGIVRVLVPALQQESPEFAKLVLAAREASHGPERNRHFQRMFEVVVARWVSGELSAPNVEPWVAFRDRVRRGFKKITAAAGNTRVALFTSGGAIGVMVQSALHAPDMSAVQLNWRVRNCSLTEFVFSKNRLSLDSFNAIPHLVDPALHSFR